MSEILVRPDNSGGVQPVSADTGADHINAVESGLGGNLGLVLTRIRE
jgi:hypothetical protein